MLEAPPDSEERSALRARASAVRAQRILTIVWVGWGVFTLLNGAQRRFVSAAVDLVVTIVTFALVRWARGRPERTTFTVHAATAATSLGLTGVSLIQGQSRAMASWFLVAVPLAAGYLAGARAAKIWTALAAAGLAVVHLSGRFVTVTPEFVHDDLEVWTGAVILCLSQLGIALAVVRIQDEDIAQLLERERVIAKQAAALAEARDAALAAARAKDEFLAMMSHEIRTPLNGILGMAEVLRAGPLDADQEREVSAILESGDVLRTILGDVLDAAKIEAGRLTLAREPFAPHAVVRSTAELFGPVARSKGLRLDVDLSPDLPPWVLGDAARVRQILWNLVGNAVKFTEVGSVLVTARSEGSTLVVEVKDTGIGISEAAQARLFEAFSQVDASAQRRFSGTGLGLHISRRIARLMGGDVEVTSREGEGSTFRLTLPAERTEAPPTSVGLAVAKAKGAVLVVDDNDINRRVAVAMLDRLGWTASAVSDGEAALEAMRAGDYRVVLMDMRMPGIDGCEATRRIRATFPREAQPTIVATTANARPADREACLAAGMDAVLPKPFTLAGLSETLHAIEATRPADVPRVVRRSARED